MDKVAEQDKQYNTFETLRIWQVRTDKTTACAKKCAHNKLSEQNASFTAAVSLTSGTRGQSKSKLI